MNYGTVDEATLATVKQVLIEVLGVEEHEIALQSTIAEDFGCESIEYLDIIFRLGKIYPRIATFPSETMSLQKLWSNHRYCDNKSCVTAEGAEAVKIYSLCH